MANIRVGPDQNHRRLAGFFTQIQVVFYKNLLLYKSNKLGIVFELIFISLSSTLFLISKNAFEIQHSVTSKPIQPINLLGSNMAYSPPRVYYFPNNEFVEKLVKKSLLETAHFSGIEFEAANHSSPDNIDSSTLVFISFSSNLSSFDDFQGPLSYTLFTSDSGGSFDSYQTNKVVEPLDKYMYSDSPESECSRFDFVGMKYTKSFLAIKNSIDLTFMNGLLESKFTRTINQNGSELQLPVKYNFFAKNFDCPAYSQNFLHSEFSFFIPIIICVCHLVTFLLNVSSIIIEKETKFREYLKLIGVRSSVITICWMIRSFIIYTILSIVITIGLKYKLAKITLLVVTSTPVTFITCFLYSIQCICLSILFGQFFSKTFWAKSVSIVMWFVTSINLFSWTSSMAKYMFAVFPNSALIFSFQIISQYERSSKVLSMTEVFTSLYDDPLRLGALWIAMIFWSVVYIFLGWYLDKVFPGEYGIKMPFYFPFMPSYWCESRKFRKSKSLDEEDLKETEETKFLENQHFEPIPPETTRSVRLRHLTKVFSNGFVKKVAVDKLTFDFCDNQITGFLGHNGAGKSTVLFMLCGLYAPTSGSVHIFDYSIRSEIDKIRSLIGYCPQINIQYDNLTCFQHLYLVCKIKGFSSKESRDEIKRIARFVGLHDDLSKQSSQLSGGMKRRLQFAMALIGDAKVIILDEPTSGLDPFNRRELWSLIKSYKSNRTIILTTHNMDEADTLSDRIAVINHGQVMCSGSPFYLKEKFGSGYRLTITKSAENLNEAEFENLYRQAMSETRPCVESSSSRETTFLIPSSLKNNLPAFLDSLEKFKNKLNIINYGISSSTVEDVFIKVGKIDLNEELSCNKDLDFTSIQNAKINHGRGLLVQQIGSLWLKRFRILKSRLTILVASLLLPALILFLYISTRSKTNTIDTFIKDLLVSQPLQRLELSLNLYPSPQKLLISTTALDSDSNDQVEKFTRFLSQFYSMTNNKSSGGIQLEIYPTRSPSTIDDQQLTMDEFIFAKRLQKPLNLVRNYYLAFEFKFAAKRLSTVVIYYNSIAYHSLAVGLNEANSLLLAYLTGSLANTIRTDNSPRNTERNSFYSNEMFMGDDELSPSSFLSCIEAPPFSVFDVIIALLVTLSIAFTSIHITRERTNGSKSLQLMSKTRSITYWLSNYLFDGVVHFLNILSIVGIIFLCYAVYDNQGSDFGRLFTSQRPIVHLGLFLLSIVGSSVTLAYLASRFFKSDILSFAIIFVVLMAVVLVDVALAIAVMLVKIAFTNRDEPSEIANPGDHDDGTVYYDRINWIRTLLSIVFPNINAKRAMYNLKIQSSNNCRLILSETFKLPYSNSSTGFDFDSPGNGKFVINAFLGLVLLLAFLIFIENQANFEMILSLLSRCRDGVKECLCRGSTRPIRLDKNEIADEVQEEATRIERADLYDLVSQEPIVAKKLCKVYKKGSKYFYAVDNLSFGVSSSECFGLLGLNGAGKTTTIEILTGQKTPNDGETYLNSFNSNSRRSSAIADLGICPQFDLLPEFLTVRETLELFGNLRGLKPTDLSDVIETLLKTFQLNEFRNKLVQTLSGGNKRKLSSAIALIGRPKTVILDEPTAGMDPVARRYLWNIIKAIRMMGTTILLTTHDMEECEALCTKLGIMVGGRFRCFGNIQNLKSKYGRGYTLILKCKASRDGEGGGEEENRANIKRVKDFVESNIRNSILKDTQSHTLFYQIKLARNLDQSSKSEDSIEEQSIAKIFNLIEQNKTMLNLENYTLSQTTLDQIFLSLADTSYTNLNDQDDNDLRV